MPLATAGMALLLVLHAVYLAGLNLGVVPVPKSLFNYIVEPNKIARWVPMLCAVGLVILSVLPDRTSRLMLLSAQWIMIAPSLMFVYTGVRDGAIHIVDIEMSRSTFIGYLLLYLLLPTVVCVVLVTIYATSKSARDFHCRTSESVREKWNRWHYGQPPLENENVAHGPDGTDD